MSPETQSEDVLKNHKHTESFGERLDIIKDRAQREQNIKSGLSEKKKSNLKAYVLFQTLLMRNPYHYQNFVKLCILFSLSKNYKATKVAESDDLRALAFSYMNLDALKVLDNLKKLYE